MGDALTTWAAGAFSCDFVVRMMTRQNYHLSIGGHPVVCDLNFGQMAILWKFSRYSLKILTRTQKKETVLDLS